MDIKIPSHFAHVATLPCETLMSAKQAVNDKLQGSVAAYYSGVRELRFGLFQFVCCEQTLSQAEYWVQVVGVSH